MQEKEVSFPIVSPQNWVTPVILRNRGVRLEPLTLAHEQGLKDAVQDGKLWENRLTSVPEPDNTKQYIENALTMYQQGQRVAFAVIDEASEKVLGSTSYYGILPQIRRLEIGYTWYRASVQRTHVNTVCKLMLMVHAFESIGSNVVGWRTDNFNVQSQRAIERLGAQRDGVIRGHMARRDGTIRDTVMYSMREGEWPEAKAQLLYKLAQYK